MALHREFDIMLLGATGYTGASTAEHIVENLPTNLKWVIAGRSQGKVEALAAKLKKLGPDRIQLVSLDAREQIDAVVRKAKVCIGVVSYWKVGTQVVEACIENGTDYVDTLLTIHVKVLVISTIRDWVRRHRERAKAASVALIHSCGVYSDPQDLIARMLVRELEEKTWLNTKEVLFSMKQIDKDSRGGSVESILNKVTLDPKVREESKKTWIMSPVEGGPTSDLTNVLGIRHGPDLGALAASPFSADQDRAVIHRTWGLLDGGKFYGPTFQYNEYEGVSSTLTGVLKMLNTVLLNILLSSSALMTVAKMLFFPSQGAGPDAEKWKHSRIEIGAVAIADMKDGIGPESARELELYRGFLPCHGCFSGAGRCISAIY
ncbi:Saccharopine dehydrogenase-domain-containing protein [Xylariales sp. AK1849]|nr:Saccharopine dehydrogenase-domain-containing protein [Xylariales sp. AK1849]